MAALSKAGAQLIAQFEGIRLALYEDPGGNATIGVGHLVHLGPINGSEPQEFKQGISLEQAYALLESDAQKAADCVTSHVKVPLSPGQTDALISFVFNVGCSAFVDSDLLALLNQGKYAAVPAQLMRWVHGGAKGAELPGLVLRRKAEGALFASTSAATHTPSPASAPSHSSPASHSSPPSQSGGAMALNSKGEVADILDVNQFQPGRSAYECVAYSAALLKYAGQPGHGPSGSTLQASNLAQYWYGREEGGNSASNTNGMSLDAEYNMLQGMGMHYQAALPTVQCVKAWLEIGYPLIICGAETGMHDLAMGDTVPYSWTPSGNHAIVASGIAHDGNLFVHDTANIGPGGVRTGPRTYDANKLQLVSATAIAVPWMPPIPAEPTKVEKDMIIDLNTPHMSDFFTLVNGNQWLCKQTNHIIHGAILEHYKTNGTKPYCGFSDAGWPLSDEVPIEHLATFAHLAGKGIVLQWFERACWIFDPNHLVDQPIDVGQVYAVKLYDNGAGTDPLVAKLQDEIAVLKAQSIQPGNPVLLTDMQQVKVISAKY